MPELPPGAAPYARTPEFSEASVPRALRDQHRTKAGVWAQIRVVEGRLLYRVLEPGAPREFTLTPEQPGVVEPEVAHCVEPIGAVRFFVEFHRG